MKSKIKTIVAAFAMLAAALPVHAQFRLTERGMVSDRDRKTEYCIVECPEKGREELFRKVAYYLESVLGGESAVFNALEPDSFTVNACVPGAVMDGKSWLRTAYDLEYRMMVDTRDGYVRIWAPEIITMSRWKVNSESSVSAGVDSPGISVIVGLPCENMKVAKMFVSEKYMPGKVGQYSSGGTVIFNKRGKLKNKYAKRSLEDYFNSLVDSIDHYINFAE